MPKLFGKISYIVTECRQPRKFGLFHMIHCTMPAAPGAKRIGYARCMTLIGIERWQERCVYAVFFGFLVTVKIWPEKHWVVVPEQTP